MPGEMRVRIWDVEHGACAMVQHVIRAGLGEHGGRLAMIDSGHGTGFRPSDYITKTMGRNRLDYLFITNADQDHMSACRGCGTPVSTCLSCIAIPARPHRRCPP